MYELTENPKGLAPLTNVSTLPYNLCNYRVFLFTFRHHFMQDIKKLEVEKVEIKGI